MNHTLILLALSYRSQNQQKTSHPSGEIGELLKRKKELADSLKEKMFKEKQLEELLKDKRRQLADSRWF